jgi:hypothetical protein
VPPLVLSGLTTPGAVKQSAGSGQTGVTPSMSQATTSEAAATISETTFASVDARPAGFISLLAA